MEYQYMQNMYGGQMPGPINGVGPSPVPNGIQGQVPGQQMPFNFSMGHNSHMMGNSATGGKAGGHIGSHGHTQGPGNTQNPYFAMQYNGQVPAPNQQPVYPMQGPNGPAPGMNSPFVTSIPPVPTTDTHAFFGGPQTAIPNPNNHTNSHVSPVSSSNTGTMLNVQQQTTQSHQAGPEITRPGQQMQAPPQKGSKHQRSSVNVSTQQNQPQPTPQAGSSKAMAQKSVNQSQENMQNMQNMGQRGKLANIPINDQNMGSKTAGNGTMAPPPQLAQDYSSYPYPLRKYLSNLAILRTHEIINLLNVSSNKLNDMKYWNQIMGETFTPYGVFRYSRKHQDDIRQFEFAAVVVPSVMRSFGSSGVARLEIVPHQLRAQLLSNGSIFFECPRCLLTYFFPDGSYITNFTHFKGVFDTTLRIEWLDMFTYSFVPGVEWGALESKLSDPLLCKQIFEKLSQVDASKSYSAPGDKSRVKSENNGEANSRTPNNSETPIFGALTQLRSQFKVFQNVSSFGIQEGFMRVLQVNDVMSYLKNLKIYQRCNSIRSPVDSLSLYVQRDTGNPLSNSTGMKRKTGTETTKESTNMAGQSASSSSTHGSLDSKKRTFSSAVSPLTSGEPMSHVSKNEQPIQKKGKY